MLGVTKYSDGIKLSVGLTYTRHNLSNRSLYLKEDIEAKIGLNRAVKFFVLPWLLGRSVPNQTDK